MTLCNMDSKAFISLVMIIPHLCLSSSVPPSSSSSDSEFSHPTQGTFADQSDYVKQLDVNMLLGTITDLKEQVKLLQQTVNEIGNHHRPEDAGETEKDEVTSHDESVQFEMDENVAKYSPKYGDGKKRARRNIDQQLQPVGSCPQPCTCPPYVAGPPGPPGPSGSPGVPGPMGRDGRDGRDWISGFLKGDFGDNVTPSVPNQSGAIYVRWGRNSCPSTSELVYNGIAGGSFYTQKGSGGNYLCLPEEPIYDETESSAHAERGRIYGGEYQTSGPNSFPPFSDLYQHDVPCAVCKASNRPSVLMIPARNVCPDDSWTKEYHGYLMSERNTHFRSEYVCVDHQPRAVPRTSANNNGALFYLVEGICTEGGGLPCGPYVNGYELTCAVCTI